MRRHAGEKAYPCSQYDKAFIHKPHIVTHMKAHSGEKQHKCSECDKAFFTEKCVCVCACVCMCVYMGSPLAGSPQSNVEL